MRQRQVYLPQGGFALIAAIVLLVVMAALATAMMRLGSVQQSTSNQGMLAMRASQAARAGVEWGLFQLRKQSCNATPQSLSEFRAASGFTVTVSCRKTVAYNEGEMLVGGTVKARVVSMYQIEAVACNGSASCPADSQVGNRDYVERRRVATACLSADFSDC